MLGVSWKSRRVRGGPRGRSQHDLQPGGVGCDGRGDQHETVFETESERVLAKLPVGEAYKPLQDSPYLLQQVVEGRQRTEFTSGGAKGGRGAGRPRAAAAPAASPEELLERGKIDIAEYRRLIALPPSGGSSSSRDGLLGRWRAELFQHLLQRKR